jgi:hypothetical protein
VAVPRLRPGAVRPSQPAREEVIPLAVAVVVLVVALLAFGVWNAFAPSNRRP